MISTEQRENVEKAVWDKAWSSNTFLTLICDFLKCDSVSFLQVYYIAIVKNGFREFVKLQLFLSKIYENIEFMIHFIEI